MSAINKFIIQGSFGGRLVKWKGRTASIAPGILFATVSAIALTTGGLSRAETYTYRDTFYNNIETEIFREFFQSLSQSAGITLHMENLYGNNTHHIIESCFKSLAISLKESVKIDENNSENVPSTKGILTGSN